MPGWPAARTCVDARPRWLMIWTGASLDNSYAGSLGCLPEDLNSGGLTVVESDMRSIRFAKGSPLALYAFAKVSSLVVAVRSGLAAIVEETLRGSTALDDDACDAIERAMSGFVGEGSWFRGVRLVCEPAKFRDCATDDVREIMPDEDERSALLYRRWGGRVFGCVVGGNVVSRVGVKPLSDVVWDLTVETLPDRRGRGYAKSAVSAALRYVFANGRLAGWGCDRDGAASLNTARSVGFLEYALDFGCVEASAEGSNEMETPRMETRQ